MAKLSLRALGRHTTTLQVSQDEDFTAFQTELEGKLEAANILFSAYCLGNQELEEDAARQQAANIGILRSMRKGCRACFAKGSLEIQSIFAFKEYSATAYYSGPLLFGDKLSITVKVHHTLSIQLF